MSDILNAGVVTSAAPACESQPVAGAVNRQLFSRLAGCSVLRPSTLSSVQTNGSPV